MSYNQNKTDIETPVHPVALQVLSLYADIRKDAPTERYKSERYKEAVTQSVALAHTYPEPSVFVDVDGFNFAYDLLRNKDQTVIPLDYQNETIAQSNCICLIDFLVDIRRTLIKDNFPFPRTDFMLKPSLSPSVEAYEKMGDSAAVIYEHNKRQRPYPG